jgi:hypothetical protein
VGAFPAEKLPEAELGPRKEAGLHILMEELHTEAAQEAVAEGAWGVAGGQPTELQRVSAVLEQGHPKDH